MKRGGSPARRTPLARSTTPLRRTRLERTPEPPHGGRLPSRSSKTAAIYRGPRGDLNRELADRPTRCALGDGFTAAGFPVCTGRATCWHERRKRSSAGSIVNRANLLPACTACNGLVEDEPDVARSLGYTAREGDPDWDTLSKRHDPRRSS